MNGYQVNGTIDPTVTTTPAILAIPDGSTGFFVNNPSTTSTVFVRFTRQGDSAPSSAEVLRGVAVQPGTTRPFSIVAKSSDAAASAGLPGAIVYVATDTGSVQISATGVI